MTDINIDFYTHSRFSNIWDELDIFRDIASEGDYEATLCGFEKYVSDHFFHDLKPFWEFTFEEVVDKEDSRYPSEEWLASIYDIGRKFCLKEVFKHGDILLEQLRTAWLWGDDDDTFYFDEETKVLTAYTSGWSGCEDIVRALRHAFPWIDGLHANLIFDMRYFFSEGGSKE